jgi:hypothetical protein
LSQADRIKFFEELDDQEEEEGRFDVMFGIKQKPTLAKNITTPNNVFNFNKQNIDLINKYRNPFKILFLWCIQEIFDI